MEDSRIEVLPETKLVGMHVAMSFAENRTGELWRSFMPRRKEIAHALGRELYSIQVYGPEWLPEAIDGQRTFEKWACQPVTTFETIPTGMEPFTLGGLYAVFLHKGPPSAFPESFREIYLRWLPRSPYTLDERPHFEVLGDKYKNEHPDSEEEIWVPVKSR